MRHACCSQRPEFDALAGTLDWAFVSNFGFRHTCIRVDATSQRGASQDNYLFGVADDKTSAVSVFRASGLMLRPDRTLSVGVVEHFRSRMRHGGGSHSMFVSWDRQRSTAARISGTVRGLPKVISCNLHWPCGVRSDGRCVRAPERVVAHAA